MLCKLQESLEQFLHRFPCQYSQLSIAYSSLMLVRDNITMIIIIVTI